MEENTEYDPNWHARTDSGENETVRNNDDIWYAIDENDDDREEPTFYDSGMWVDDASFDHHNEADLVMSQPEGRHVTTATYPWMGPKFIEPS